MKDKGNYVGIGDKLSIHPTAEGKAFGSMTVVAVYDDGTVDAVRPYVVINENLTSETRAAWSIGIEQVNRISPNLQQLWKVDR